MFRSIACFIIACGVTHCMAQTMQMPPKYIRHSNKGTVTLLATGFGDKKNAVANARKSAFEALLFRGIAEAPKPKLRDPFLRDEEKSKEQFPDFFWGFFDQEGYLQYINSLSSPQKTKIKGLGKKKAFQLEITINYEALLRDLRKEGLIPKPGF